MGLFPGWAAPDFSVATTQGPIEFHRWIKGGWAIVVSHTDDFTPQSRKSGALWSRSSDVPVKLLGLSGKHSATDGHIPDIAIVFDTRRSIAALWDGFDVDVMVSEKPASEHMVFFVDPGGTIRITQSFYPEGPRDFTEIIHMLRALDNRFDVQEAHTRAA